MEYLANIGGMLAVHVFMSLNKILASHLVRVKTEKISGKINLVHPWIMSPKPQAVQKI